MTYDLDGKKVAILAADGVEQQELTVPYNALKKANAVVHIISIKTGNIHAWNQGHWGEHYVVDHGVSSVSVNDYDALVLPGGVMNPDKLRQDTDAVAFVRHFFEQGKVVGAICHAAWTLIEANAVRGRKMTSYPSLKTDLRNAGANWIDEEVVTDHGLVTSRNIPDLPKFTEKLIEEIAEGKHRLQKLKFLGEEPSNVS